MTTIANSDSPQHFVFQPLPENLNRRQRDDYLQDICVTDLRSAFALITNLQKQITELQLNKGSTIVPPSPSTPSTILLTPSPAPGRSADLVMHARCDRSWRHACSEFGVCELALVSATRQARCPLSRLSCCACTRALRSGRVARFRRLYSTAAAAASADFQRRQPEAATRPRAATTAADSSSRQQQPTRS